MKRNWGEGACGPSEKRPTLNPGDSANEDVKGWDVNRVCQYLEDTGHAELQEIFSGERCGCAPLLTPTCRRR